MTFQKCVIVKLHFFSLVRKARDLGSSFFNFHWLGVPEPALCGIPLNFGIVVVDKLLKNKVVHCIHSEWSQEAAILKRCVCVCICAYMYMFGILEPFQGS